MQEIEYLCCNKQAYIKYFVQWNKSEVNQTPLFPMQLGAIVFR